MYFNWKLAVVIVISILVVGVTAFGLRKWQRSNRAVNSLQTGLKAFEEQNWPEAVNNLGIYLGVEAEDVDILSKYAQAQLNIRPSKLNNIQQAINAYRIILRVDSANADAAVKLTNIYLVMNMPGEAELIAKRFPDLKNNPELNRIYALSLQVQKKYELAAQELKNIIAEHPDQILAYDLLARLNRFQPGLFTAKPVDWLNQCVANNPSSAMAYVVRAGFNYANKDFDAVAADLETAEKLGLQDSADHLRIAQLYIAMDLFDKAEKHLEVVKAAEPTNISLWRTWIQLGSKTGSSEKIVSITDSALKAMSAQPWDILPLAAEVYIKNKQYDSAEKCISQLTQNEMDQGTVAFLSGLLAETKGNSYDAVRHWQRAIQLGNKTPRLALALLMARLGDAQSALQQLNTLVVDDPENINAHLALARLSVKIGDWARVAESSQAVLHLSPGNEEAALLFCQARLNILSSDSAAKNTNEWGNIQNQLTKLSKTSENNIGIKLTLFQSYLLQEQYDQAGQFIEDLKKEYPSEISVDISEARLYIARNQKDKAVEVLKNAISKYPDSITPVEMMAAVLSDQGKQQECEKLINDAVSRIESVEDLRELKLLLVEYNTFWGDQEKAFGLLETLADEYPDDIPIKHRLLGFKQMVDNPERSKQIIEDIKRLEGDQGWQWKYEQAKLWFAAGNFEQYSTQIISLLKENLLANPGDLSNLVLLAKTYEKTGNLQLAISTYQQALDRAPGDMRIIVPLVAALYKANEYDQADRLLNSIPKDEATHPGLVDLKIQNYVRHGQLESASDILEKLLLEEPENQEARLALAVLYVQQKKYEKADVLLDQIIAFDPESISAIAAKVKLKVVMGDADQAIKICDDTVKRLNTVTSYIMRAKAYFALGQNDKARQDFDTIVAMEPDNYEVWAHRSDFYRNINDNEKAIADIRRALKIDNSNIQIQKRAISLLISSQDPALVAEGNQILSDSLKMQPDNTELMLVKSQLLLTEGTASARQESERILRQITENSPQTSLAWSLLGELMLGQGNQVQALDIAMRGLYYNYNNKALLLLKARAESASSPFLAIPTYKMLSELYPEDFNITMFLVKAYVDAEEYDKAVELANNQLSVRTDPDQIKRCNIALLTALYKDGKKSRAGQIYDTLKNTYPDDSVVLMSYCQLLSEGGQWSDLKNIVTDWMSKNPSDTQTPVNIAEILISVQNTPDSARTAEDIFNMIIAKHPDTAKAIHGLAIVKQMTQDYQEAIRLNRQVLLLEPENTIAMNNLAWMLCQQQGDYKQALEIVNKGLEITPNFADMIDTRGVIYYKMGKFEEAIKDFIRCSQLYSEDMPAAVSTYFHLGKAYAGLKQTDMAIKNLRTSLDMNTRIGGLTNKEIQEARELIKALSERN